LVKVVMVEAPREAWVQDILEMDILDVGMVVEVAERHSFQGVWEELELQVLWSSNGNHINT